MRLLFLTIFACLLVMGVFAHTVVRPQTVSADPVIDAYFAVGDEPGREDVAGLMAGFRARAEELGLAPIERFADIGLLGDDGADGELKRAYRRAFQRYYEDATGRSLLDTPTLIWATDANPARDVQMALFREWHIRTFGEPVNIATDPSNRELTKAIVQSVAGAGPDIIEYIGGADLRSLVKAGIALDVTEYARRNGLGPETVFPALVSTICVDGADGRLHQYAYPCNVDYRMLLYHRDLFEQAGVEPPTGGWTIDELREAGERVLRAPGLSARPRFTCMNLKPFEVGLGAGGRLFPVEHQAYSIYDSPQTIAGLKAFQDLMYVYGAMPKPAEAASMSASTAGGFGSDMAGSAPGLFCQKAILTYVGGRWEYVSFAIANRDRVIVPAMDRRLAQLDNDAPEAALLRSARAKLLRDVLRPVSDEEYAAVDACLTDADRARLLHVGVAHVPTVTGKPYYMASARCALVNRALERDHPKRLEYALRFLRFLGSREYSEQINGTYDSICGRVEFCIDENGVSGAPAPLPGLEGMDSSIYVQALLDGAEPWELSPYIGRTRLTVLVNEVLEGLQAGTVSPEEAALEAEEKINRQIIANVRSDEALREQWMKETGVDPATIEPGRRDAQSALVTIRAQIEAAVARARGGVS